MENREKTEIQEVVDLLEENGYHVFKAEENIPERRGIASPAVTIELRIAPKGEWKGV